MAQGCSLKGLDVIYGSKRTSTEQLLQLKLTEAVALMELRTLGCVRPRHSATFSTMF